MQYPNLDHILTIPEEDYSNLLDFTGFSEEQKKEQRKRIVSQAVSKREEEIQKVQIENKRWRIQQLQKANENEVAKSVIIEKCKRDVIYFFESWLWTYNPRLANSHLPFILYPFQKAFILQMVEGIEKGGDYRIEKSRDMGFSRIMLGIALRGFLFKGRSGLIGSYKEDYVDDQGNMDAAFERLRYMIERLPAWMKPKDLLNKYMNISSQTLGCSIDGDCGANFGTGGRRKWVFLDEFSLWQYDRTAEIKTKDISNCRIFGGTPNGLTNVYGKVMTDHQEFKHILKTKIRLFRTSHPLKTSAWYELQKLSRTKLALAQEVDISYENSVSGAVYPLFSQMAHFDQKILYDASLPLYTGWDFGLDTLAFICANIDFRTGRIFIFDAFQRVNWDLLSYCGLVIGRPVYDNHWQYTEEDRQQIEKSKIYKYTEHFGDPYNIDNRSVISQEQTIRTILRKVGIDVRTNRKSTLEERIRKVQQRMGDLYIDRDLFDLITALQQSRYPEVRENSQQTIGQTKPIHNIYSHYRTALEYLIDNLPSVSPNMNTPIARAITPKIQGMDLF